MPEDSSKKQRQQPSVVKHLVTCSCVLPPLKHRVQPIPSRFIAVSLVESTGRLREHLVQCPVCGVSHKVTEIGKSEILHGRAPGVGVLSQEEIETNLPPGLVSVLKANDASRETYEEVWLAMDNAVWGHVATLSKEEISPGEWVGKRLLLIGKSLWKVESWSRSDNVDDTKP